MGEPGFWDDQDAAAKTNAEYARANRRLTTFDGPRGRRRRPRRAGRDRRGGPRPRGRGRGARCARVEARLEELELERLFSGRYDAGDALVTVNAGAGGTDAQDWAEMLLRMEMRWAERRGFKVELLEASPGEEAGIKSATFRVSRRERLRPLRRREGRAPARAHLAVRRARAAARRRSPASRSRRSSTTSASIEIDDDDLQVDTYRASGAGGQHVNKTDSAVRITHRPTRHRRAVPERALAVAEQAHGDEDAAAPSSPSCEERERREEIAKEKGEAHGRRLRLADPLLRPAPVHDGQGPPDELRDGRRHRVLDGDLDGFVRAYLLQAAA